MSFLKPKSRILQSSCLSFLITICVLGHPERLLAEWIETVLVGNPGNASDPNAPGPINPTVGVVDYHYRIGKTEITNAQYAEFLNSIAAADPHRLHHPRMNGIVRRGTPGNYAYTLVEGLEEHPVGFVDIWDAFRFANWLHNNRPIGIPDQSTTESGAYALDGVTWPENDQVRRLQNAKWAIPSWNEWHKAAYHKNDGPTSNYYLYPTSNDESPQASEPTSSSNSGSFFRRELDAVASNPAVGSYPHTVSPYGTLDQAGSLAEWVDDVSQNTILNESARVILGGGFVDDETQSRSNSFGWNRPTNELFSVGFRVARPNVRILGDLDDDGFLTAADLDLLAVGESSTDIEFDLNDDGAVDSDDRRFWLLNLAKTQFGDLDLNGSVDFSDFLTLSVNFGVAGARGWSDGDLNGNGEVEFEDFLILSSHFGDTSEKPAIVGPIVAVPEPSTIPVAQLSLLFYLSITRMLRRTS